MGHSVNIDLHPENVQPASSDYIHLLQRNAFFSLITSPTGVTPTQTSIDHIFTNTYESRYQTTTLYFVL